MPQPHPGLGLPTSIERSRSRRGCGCCQHCQCTGSCVEVEYVSDMSPVAAPPPPQLRSPSYSRSPSPLPPATYAAPSTVQKKSDFLSVMEHVTHPGDMVSLSRKSSRNHGVSTDNHNQPLTPAISSRRDGALRSRSNSEPDATSNERDKEREKEKRGKASRPASPLEPISDVVVPIASWRDKVQEEYEAGYRSHSSRRHHKRIESDVEVRAMAPSDEEDMEEQTRGVRRKDRNGSRKVVKAYDTDGEEQHIKNGVRRKDSRKEQRYEEEGGEVREIRRKDRNGSRKDRVIDGDMLDNKDMERSRRKQQQHHQRGNSDARTKEDEEAAGQDDQRGRNGEDREKESRARSKSRPREPIVKQPSTDSSSTVNKDQIETQVQESTLYTSTTTGGQQHNRSKSRNETVEYLQNKIGSKRELIKELIKSSTPIPVNQIIKPLVTNAINSNNYNTSVTHVDLPRAIDVQTGNDTKFGSFNAIKKLSVHIASDYGLMLHFLDWSRRNDANEPLVAFRLEDAEQGSYEKKSGGLFSRKQGPDWLQESHENGAKVRGRLSLGVGIRGPILYNIDVKRRKVDKFVITGTPDHLPDYEDHPHYGSHEDYRHVYFETPDGRIMKWYLAEPGRLMRLYGRGEKDYGKLYAEARMQRSDSKKQRGAKEVQIFFYDPNHPDQPTRRTSDKVDGKLANDGEVNLDFAFMCATWWCARQTFDESKLVEAHAEVELIENIEKVFEVDLLAGA